MRSSGWTSSVFPTRTRQFGNRVKNVHRGRLRDERSTFRNSSDRLFGIARHHRSRHTGASAPNSAVPQVRPVEAGCYDTRIWTDATKPGTTIIRSIPTGGKFRVDEMAYDPIDRILMISNDGDSPPFLTFISIRDGPSWATSCIQPVRMAWNNPSGFVRLGCSTRMCLAIRTVSMCSIPVSSRIRSRASRCNVAAD